MPNDKDFELDDLESFSFDDLPLDDAETSAPGAAEDPFGVWVKSGPEDESLAADTSFPESPAPAPADDSLPEDDFLSSEELASLDDNFEFVTVDESGSEMAEPLEDEIAFFDSEESRRAEAEAEAEPSFDDISLDDFVSFDDGTDAVEAAASTPLEAPAEPAEDESPEEFLDIDIDIEDDIGDEELEIIKGALPSPSSEDLPTEPTFESENIDLSEFGEFDSADDELAVPLEDDPLSAGPSLPAEGDSEPELPDLPDLDVDLGSEFEPLAVDTVSAEDDTGDGVFEEIILDDEPEVVAAGLEPQDETDLDHIMALEEDLTSGIRSESAPVVDAPAPPPAPAQDVAALLLSKIEQELSTIKQEITALKNEVTNLRPAAPVVTPGEPVPSSAEAPKGFFDEEDDETIALTGDELDNILSTAEISEEDETGESLDDDLLATDAEGNLVTEPLSEEPEPSPTVAAEEWQDGPVSDEEFLSGTALESDGLGIPDSIELEDDLPESLDEIETQNLLKDSSDTIDPLGNALPSEPLEIPVDDDLADELALSLPDDSHQSLAEDFPEPVEEAPVPESLELPEEETTLSLDEIAPSDTDVSPLDADGWSPAEVATEPVVPPTVPQEGGVSELSPGLKDELRAVLTYMDKLLSSLPDDKIQEFAESEHFEVYKRLFEELGLID